MANLRRHVGLKVASIGLACLLWLVVAGAPIEWAVASVPVKIVGDADVGQLTPDTVTVHVQGPRDAMTSRVEDFEATVDVTGLSPGELQVLVHVVTPEGVGVVRVEPPELRVRIR